MQLVEQINVKLIDKESCLSSVFLWDKRTTFTNSKKQKIFGILCVYVKKKTEIG